MEQEPALNKMDAKLQLDAFQRQYEQLSSSHNSLISSGRSVVSEMSQSDEAMFGPGAGGSSTHSAVTKVEGVVERMVGVYQRMEGVARPRLKQLQTCYQFYNLKQTCNKVSNSPL